MSQSQRRSEIAVSLLAGVLTNNHLCAQMIAAGREQQADLPPEVALCGFAINLTDCLMAMLALKPEDASSDEPKNIVKITQ